MPYTPISTPKLHFRHVARDMQQDEVLSEPLCRNLPARIAPPRDDGFAQRRKHDRIHDGLWLLRVRITSVRMTLNVLDVGQTGEVREECRGGWGAGDELMTHDAKMGELAEQGGAFRCSSEGGVPVVVGHEEGEVGAEGVAVV